MAFWDNLARENCSNNNVGVFINSVYSIKPDSMRSVIELH